MTPEEFAREFEKAPKNLMKANPRELLFEEDYPEGRMKLVCAAMNEECEKLNLAVESILTQPEGAKHLVRALNNLKSIGHKGALCFAKVIYDALDKDWDENTRLLKFIQILDCVSSDLRTGMDWISVKAAQFLDEGRLDGEIRILLWLHWCAAVLRSSPEATPLIEDIASRRPQQLSKTQVNGLRDDMKDETVPWDIRGASAFLLLGNQLLSIDKAQAFVEEAYASFPLEALEGVEILAIAVENDASKLAEFDVIQSKLAQIRKENLFLRDMKFDAFIETSNAVFEQMNNLPATAIELALELQNRDKNERLILSAFIDDARKADWLYLARKSGAIKALCRCFFEHFNAENPIVRAFSAELVMNFLENHNADALLAETWMEAITQADIETLKQHTPAWISFCKE